MAGFHHCVDGCWVQLFLHPVEDGGTGLGILKGIVVLEREVDTLCQGIEGAVRQLGIKPLGKLPGAVVAQFGQLYIVLVKGAFKHSQVEACIVGHHDIITDKCKNIGPDVGKGGGISHILRVDAVNRDIKRIKAHLGRGYQGVEFVQNLVPIKAHHTQCTGAGFGAVGCLEIKCDIRHIPIIDLFLYFDYIKTMLRMCRVLPLLIATSLLCSCVALSKIDNYEEKAKAMAGAEEIHMADTESINNVNGQLPDTIYLKTATQTFNKDYQFSLEGGRIFYKSRTGAKGPAEWEPLETGLPYSKIGKFKTPKRVIALAGDVDSILAMDQDGKVYEYYFERTTIRRHITWYHVMGFPTKGQLALNRTTGNSRAWTAGTRRSEVLWYEDIFGNQHHYGSMGIETYYMMNDAGDTIRFTDSGLPADLSRSMPLPERGAFIARNISASASTLFVINDAGEMYTRLIDFDTMGGDPMFFLYTYKNEKQPYDGTQYITNFTEWGLPNEEWAKQPGIPLSGKARITRHITIFQTGRGNEARELRVGGLSPEGKTGFYYKNLKDKEWQFREVEMHFAEESFLDTTIDPEALRKPKQEIAYNGSVKLPEGKEMALSIPDFMMSDGDCTLKFTLGSETAEIKMYPVEIWSYMYRLDPGMDGTPKLFFVTFSLEDLEKQNLSPEFRDIIETLFKDKNLELFACRAEATKDLICITMPDTPYGDVRLLLSATGEANPDTFKFTYLYDSPILGYYMDDAMKSDLERNKEYLKLVKQGRKLSTSFHRSAISASLYYQSFDLFTAVTLLNHVNYPKIKTVTSFGDQIVQANKELYTQLEKNHKIIYTHLIELLEERIKALESGQQLPGDTLQDYLDEAGIPLKTCKDIPYFPGFLINIDDGKPLLVEMKYPLKKIKAYTAGDKKKFNCDVVYHSPEWKEMDGRSGKLVIKDGKLTLTAAEIRHPVFSQDLP